jgi:putative membrane protein
MTKRVIVAAGMICLAVGCTKKPEELGGKNSPSSSDKDNKFITTAAEADMTEIQTGEMADKQSMSPEVKAYGKMIVEDHKKATAEVAKAATAVGATPPPELDSEHMKIVDDVKGKTGSDFDKAFIDDQIKAHKEALDAAMDEQKDGTNPQVKELATALIPTLQKHLSDAKGLKEKMSDATTKPVGM